jgi:hypothetical protein
MSIIPNTHIYTPGPSPTPTGSESRTKTKTITEKFDAEGNLTERITEEWEDVTHTPAPVLPFVTYGGVTATNSNITAEDIKLQELPITKVHSYCATGCCKTDKY